MRRSRYHRDIAQAHDVWREIARPLWQARLCLCAGKGCLPLSGRRAVDLSVLSGRAWQDDTPLLDDGVSKVPPAITMHDWAAAADPTLGTRAPAGGRSGASRREPGSHACAPRDRRASIRYDEGADGRDALLDKDPAESRHRDGTLRAGLQPDAGDEYRRRQTAYRSDRGIAGSAPSLTGRLHCPDPHRGTQMPMAFIHVENSPTPMITTT